MPQACPPLSLPRIVGAALLASGVLCASATWAERADRDQPMHIQSDALRHDELQQTSVFTGNVVATKGSIVLRGARLDVRQDAQGYQFGTVTGAAGQRAFFRQKRDTAPGAPQEYVEGEAEVIEYDGRKDDVRLVRRGQLRRFTDGKLSDDITGSLITYNSITDVFTVDGSAQPTPGGSNRVRAVLAPKASPAGAGAGADAGSGAAPLPLQPSPQMAAPQEP